MKSKEQYPRLHLATSRQGLNLEDDAGARARLGGVTIYARSDGELRQQCDRVLSAFDSVTRAHASLARSHLEWLVQKEIKLCIDRRVLGALLGAALRTGIVDQIPCAAVSGKIFRVVIHASARAAFEERLITIGARLRNERVLHVRVVRDELFPKGGWGTWSSATHVLARLVVRGSAKYVDAKAFAWPEEVDRAVRDHS